MNKTESAGVLADKFNTPAAEKLIKPFNDFSEDYKDYWDKEGQPINQEDLAYTLQTFSWVGVRGLRTLGLGLSDKEELAIIHCWRLAGHHMGIQDELVPESVEESEAMFEAMKKRLAYYDRGTSERRLVGRTESS